MKLSLRLKSIAELFDQNHYSRFIDTCCDHGQLGLYISKKFPGAKFTFVDVIPSIIKNLESDSRFANFELTCMSAEKIKVVDKPSLILIAGVGGELASKIINGICEGNPASDKYDFIVSPNNKSHLVRQELSNKKFKSIEEKIVTDNGISYEIIYSALNRGEEFDNIGKRAFHLELENHLQYLNKKCDLYRVKSKHDSTMINLFNEYNKLLSDSRVK